MDDLASGDVNIQSLLKLLNKAVSIHGLEKVNQTLYELIVIDKNGVGKGAIETVISAVCEEFNVSPSALIRSRYNRSLTESKSICYCILHFELGMTIRDVGKNVFKREHTRPISIAIEKHKSLNPAIKSDREYKSRYDKVLASFRQKYNPANE